MGIRQATNMASFLHAHPALQGLGMGKGKESGVMGGRDAYSTIAGDV